MSGTGILFVVSAPSGAGKTSLCQSVRLAVPDLAYSVSCTTRPPRRGEVDGVDFQFLTESAFRELADRGGFAEWAVVHGNLYGTRADRLEAVLGEGRDVLLDIDTQGAAQLRARYPQAVLVFVVTPSLAELAARLRARSSDDEAEIARRLGRAREEVRVWRQYHYLLVNRDLAETAGTLAGIVRAERARTSRLSLSLPDLEVVS